mmetsp:Transcript_50924/g.69951  ORF Transcript_50924/g.69951 Transcript_50924/m.69951 type:complete len:102 (+) Transcript_50924:103-408(+)
MYKCDFKKPYIQLWYEEPIEKDSSDKVRGLIPLRSSHMDCAIYDGMATMDLQFEFVNEYTENPVETTLEFPCDKTTIITKVLATIGDRTVEAKVEKKDKAV